MTNPNELAFPNKDAMGDGPEGLTKREYFSAMAMAGLLSRKSDSDTIQLAVLTAMECADQLIAQLNKETQK